jgi:membrane-associated phospholipid phosphatase
MNLFLLIGLLIACAVLMLVERSGVPTTLKLSFKGDLKRESQFLAQWGQSVATPLVALAMWQLDKNPAHKHAPWLLVCAVLGTSISCFCLKRICGRVRPNRENAGKFLGPSLKHANYRESFPSSHSACAVALSVFLAGIYPAGAITFWGLAVITSALRYALDAHWPSDVLGGIALGYSVAHWWLWMFGFQPTYVRW